MRKHRLPQKVCLFVILLAVLGWGLNTRIHRSGETGSDTEQQSVIMDVARGFLTENLQRYRIYENRV